MKKIINSKLYDTDTATEIGNYYQFGRNDFRYIDESLYQKKNGEFFLWGEGGPLTYYAAQCGDMKESGVRIIPLSEEEAKEWVEHHMDAETYCELFGEPEE